MINRIYIGTVLFLITLSLIGCTVSEIIDITHNDTNDLLMEGKFDIELDSKLSNYKVADVLFVPFFNTISFSENNGKTFYIYNLGLKSYMKNGVNKEVIINSVTVEGRKEVLFYDISKRIEENLVYEKIDENGELRISDVILIEQINDYNMELNSNSELKIILDVSIKEGEEENNTSLEYYFNTSIRKYISQR